MTQNYLDMLLMKKKKTYPVREERKKKNRESKERSVHRALLAAAF